MICLFPKEFLETYIRAKDLDYQPWAISSLLLAEPTGRQRSLKTPTPTHPFSGTASPGDHLPLREGGSFALACRPACQETGEAPLPARRAGGAGSDGYRAPDPVRGRHRASSRAADRRRTRAGSLVAPAPLSEVAFQHVGAHCRHLQSCGRTMARRTGHEARRVAAFIPRSSTAGSSARAAAISAGIAVVASQSWRGDCGAFGRPWPRRADTRRGTSSVPLGPTARQPR
jgi:hypothetical protein